MKYVFIPDRVHYCRWLPLNDNFVQKILIEGSLLNYDTQNKFETFQVRATLNS